MLYKLKLAACFGIPEAFGTCIISLVDESEKRALSIMTNEYVAEQLKACNSKTSDFKNDVISVLWTLFDRLNVDDFYLEFDATPERGVFATLVNKITNERMSIKTDQAVLLSVAADIEMYTTELVIKEISTPFNRNDMSSTSCAVPISALPDQMLEKALDSAINEEDYEFFVHFKDFEQNVWNLGHPFFHKYTLIFDQDNQEIGIDGELIYSLQDETEAELKKIKHGNKWKIILWILFLLALIVGIFLVARKLGINSRLNKGVNSSLVDNESFDDINFDAGQNVH